METWIKHLFEDRDDYRNKTSEAFRMVGRIKFCIGKLETNPPKKDRNWYIHQIEEAIDDFLVSCGHKPEFNANYKKETN